MAVVPVHILVLDTHRSKLNQRNKCQSSLYIQFGEIHRLIDPQLKGNYLIFSPIFQCLLLGSLHASITKHTIQRSLIIVFMSLYSCRKSENKWLTFDFLDEN